MLPFSGRSRRTPDSPISFYVKKALESPEVISFAAGLVDEESLPFREVAAVAAEILNDPQSARAALQYGSTQGFPALREKVLRHVCTADGVNLRDSGLSPDDVVITTGSQQMLYLLGEILFDPGDIVLVEAPSYFVFHDCLRTGGVRIVSIPMDDGGLIPEELETALSKLEKSGELPRVKALYTVDYFQNPTGLTLTRERRPQIVDIIRKFSKSNRIIILEDAAYRELRYDGPDLPSLLSFDANKEHVVYASTFSKPWAPGLKTGYSILPRDLVAPICDLKGNHDFGSSNLNQHILNRVLGNGAFHGHLVELRTAYRAKRDAMVEAVSREFADWPEVSWTAPAGGFYVWLTMPESIDTGRGGTLLERCLEAGVLYVPGEHAHVPDVHGHIPRNEIRLCFGVATVAEIREGISRLRTAAEALRESLMSVPAG